ncbi:MAG: hypothetical protein SPI03_08475 [Campylobacter sputorum]|uniref:hypothetical protein n=1 Tax=Campylobacter sputorum TaxID=206 RepID=UPI000B76F706|nr:hypothetical protein [Campylobacter sputorum]ASM37637.1 hypothetical protein CSPARA_0021 [Campylobacter sputorum bv. paraureolyticus LMG 11764]MDY6121349.1 hypothetical protein [Campylobacter sputorum]
MRYIILAILFFLLNGCSLKLSENVPKEQYYILEYSGKEKCQNSSDKHLLFIDLVKASLDVDTRFINVKNGYKFDKLDGAKFVALPTEMVRKAVFKSFYSSCKIEPKIVMKDDSYIFKSEISALQIDKSRNVAIFEMIYSVDKETKSLVSDIKRVEVSIKKDEITAINEAMSLALDAILHDIENKL